MIRFIIRVCLSVDKGRRRDTKRSRYSSKYRLQGSNFSKHCRGLEPRITIWLNASVSKIGLFNVSNHSYNKFPRTRKFVSNSRRCHDEFLLLMSICIKKQFFILFRINSLKKLFVFKN